METETPALPPSPRVTAWLCWGALALACGAGLFFAGFTVDDAYISFRYARNLVDHGVWNWNPSSADPVEAYTSPAYAALAIVPVGLGFSPPLFFKALGAATICAVLFTVKSLFRDRQDGAWLLGALFFVSDLYIFAHAFSGLETLLFFYAAFLALVLDEQGQLTDDRALPLMVAAPLIRPEGAVITAYILYLRLRRFVSDPEPVSQPWLAAALGALMLYLVLHYAYFHDVFPNTYYAKTGSLNGALNNIVTERHAILFGLSALAVLVWLRRGVILPSLLIAMYFATNITSDMQMNYGLRFAHHLLAPVWLFAFCLLVREKLPQGFGAKAFAPFFVIALAPLTLIEPADFKYIITYTPYVRQSHASLGRALAEFRSKGYVLATGDAGQIPYYAGWNVIDYIGLANKEIARHIAKGEPVKLKAPDLFITFSGEADSCEPHDPPYTGEKLVLAAMKRSDYACVLGPRWAEEYYLHVLVRKSLPDRKRITEAIGTVRKNSLAYRKNGKVGADILQFVGLREP